MFRRRRRRSSFARPSVIKPWMVIGAGGLLFVGLFVFLMRQAETHPPQQHPMQIDVPLSGVN